MLKRLLARALVKRTRDEATQHRIKELEYKISITKHSVRRKKLQQQLKDLLK